MNKILLIDKPAGWTSFDVVAKIRGTLQRSLKNEDGIKKKRIKVGHSGTLDPFATGLLVIGVGSYTKKLTELTGLDKTYEVTAVLGKTSTTGDPEGDIEAVSNVQPTQAEILEIFKQFTGDIEQVPPAFSAKKVNGKRAYDLARAGKEVKLEPVEVTIHNLELISYQYPELKFRVKVSKGTYIRTLAEDIGWALTTGAYLTQLRRTEVGEYNVEQSISPEDSQLIQVSQ